MLDLKKFLTSVAVVAALASPALAQPPQPSAVGVPHVGTSAGPFCTSVIVEGVQFAVPNSDSNAAAMLAALSGAEGRGQSISAFTPADLGTGFANAQCAALANPDAVGVLLPHLYAYR